jgi:uncharacterized protein YjlB
VRVLERARDVLPGAGAARVGTLVTLQKWISSWTVSANNRAHRVVVDEHASVAVQVGRANTRRRGGALGLRARHENLAIVSADERREGAGRHRVVGSGDHEGGEGEDRGKGVREHVRWEDVKEEKRRGV